MIINISEQLIENCIYNVDIRSKNVDDKRKTELALSLVDQVELVPKPKASLADSILRTILV